MFAAVVIHCLFGIFVYGNDKIFYVNNYIYYTADGEN